MKLAETVAFVAYVIYVRTDSYHQSFQWTSFSWMQVKKYMMSLLLALEAIELPRRITGW